MSRRFVGTPSYLYRTTAPLTAAPLTLACWFRADSDSADQAVMWLGNSSNNDHYFAFDIRGTLANDPLRAIHSAGSNAVASAYGPGGNGFAANTWHHGAAVFASTASRVGYLDGVAGTEVTTSISAPTVNNFGLGVQYRPTIGDQFNGNLAEAAVWNVALTAEEVAALAKGIAPLLIRPQSLVCYWPLITDAIDLKSGVSLTTSGTVNIADHVTGVFYPTRAKIGKSIGIAAAAAAVALAVEVPTHTLVAHLRADATPVEIAIGVPAHEGTTGPPSIGVGITVPAATLVAGPSPVGIAVEIPTHTLYPGASSIAIAVGVPAVGGGQIALVPATGIAIGVPTTTLQERPAVTVSIAGVDQRVRRRDITLHEALNHEVDTATFTVEGFKPEGAQPVFIHLGDTLIFGGSVVRVAQRQEGDRRDLIVYDVEARDQGRLIDRRLVNGSYTTTAADVIARDILTRYTSGFTTVHIVTGLPSIDEIQFTDESPSGALTRIAQRIGGYWYVDPDRDVHLFLTETDDAPDPITDDDVATVMPDLNVSWDVSQVRTRVIVEGGGSNTAGPVAAGATLLPVEDGAWYGDTGGWVKVATERLSYTGRLVGGSGSSVRSLPAPTSTPTAALASIGGGVLGAVNYRVTFKNDAGETLPGPVSNTVTGAAVSPPGSAPGLSAAPGGGRLVGAFGYVVTFLTARGETTVGPGASITAAAFTTPGPPTLAIIRETVAGNSVDSMGRVIGAVSYKVGFVTAEGETLPSSATAITVPAYAPLAQPGATEASGVTDLQGDSTFSRYHYKSTFVNADGETLGGSTASVSPRVGFTAQAPGVSWSGVAGGSLTASSNYGWRVVYLTARRRESPYSSTGTIAIGTTNKSISLTFGSGAGIPGVVGKRIYRTRANGSTYYLVAEILDTSTTNVVDGAADDSLVVAMNQVIAGNAVTVTAPTGPAGTVARRIYRSKYNDTSGYYFVGEVTGPSGGSFVDIRGDLDLGDPMPLSTPVGGKVTVTIPTGPTGTLARRIYRAWSGGEYRQLVELQNNSQTTYVDNTIEATGPAPPLVATAGGVNIIVTVPTGPAGTVARVIYRTKAGGGPTYFVAQLSDNTTTTYTDSKIDTELGAEAPPVNTAGASAVDVTLPIGPSGITARRLYRRDSAGVYRFVAEIPNNTATAMTDALDEDALGEVAPTVGTIGALPGATELLLTDASAYPSGGGWIYIGNSLVRFTGRDLSPARLTGIPASGDGAILTAISVGADALTAAVLTGIPASGDGAVTVPIKAGEPVNILVERNDTGAQALLASLEGGDGVHEYKLNDHRLSIQGATDRADAELALFAAPIVTVDYRTRDPKTRTGRTISINLGAPTNLIGDFKIQRVSRTQLGLKSASPLCTVTASSVKFSLEDVLRRVTLRAA